MRSPVSVIPTTRGIHFPVGKLPLSLVMTRKKGPPGPGPGHGSGAEQQRSPNAATLPGYLDPAGAHGDILVALMKPAVEGEKLPTNPFTIAKSIHDAVGSIHSAWRNKDGHMVIKVRGEVKFKKLLRMNQLLGSPQVAVTVEEHGVLNRTKVVVTCRSVEGITDEELKNEPTLQAQGVVDVRRFNRAGQPTNTMTVTVRGTVAPEAIYFGFERCAAKPFQQQPMQCYKCFYYGHTKNHCPEEKERCRNCSGTHDLKKDNDQKTICPNPARCLHCNQGHSPTSRVCEQYREEEEVLRVRNSLGKSPREARIYVEEQKRQKANSYAKIAAGQKSVQDRIVAAQQPTVDIAKIQKELEESRKALAAALQEIQELKKEKEASPSDMEIVSEDEDESEDESGEEDEADDAQEEDKANDEDDNEEDNGKNTKSGKKAKAERETGGRADGGSKNSEAAKRKHAESSNGKLAESSDDERTKKKQIKSDNPDKSNKGQGKPKQNGSNTKKKN